MEPIPLSYKHWQRARLHDTGTYAKPNVMKPTGTATPLPEKPKSFALDFRLDPERMEKCLAGVSGYDPWTMPQPLRDAIRAGLEETGLVSQAGDSAKLLPEDGTSFTNIRGGYRVSDSIRIHPEKQTVIIDEVPFRVGDLLVNRWENTEEMALVLCTAGEEAGRRADRHRLNEDYLSWYCTSLISTLLVSVAMEELLRKLETDATSGGFYIAGCGFPGNDGWTLTDQPRLFRLLPEDFCGVGITGGGMLSPVASLCGLVGLTRQRARRHPFRDACSNRDARSHRDACRECRLQNCLFRHLHAEPLTALTGNFTALTGN